MDLRDLHEFDSETGEELEHSIKRSLDIEADIAIEEGEALEQLKASQGYKVFQKFLDEAISHHQNELLKARDMDKVIRSQEIISSYLGLKNWIDVKIQASHDLKEEKKLQTGSSSKA